MSSPEPAPPPTPRATARSVDSRLTRGLTAFGRPATGADALPGGTRARLAGSSQLGTNVELARKARKGPDGHDYFLVAGQGSIALVNQNGSGSIDDIDHALSGQNVSFQDCASGGKQVRVVGLLPHAATNPVVTLADGTRHTLEVINNVYVGLFDRAAPTLPQTVEFDLDGQHQVVQVAVPGDLLTTTCGPPPGTVPVPEVG
jgi:hypothetical protein